ncbi:pentapeptide repeat-containing protein [Streptomyces sp. NPDC051133]|uniref:pentapeptide repeat-containing protein n=1 Tax=Streptomyces sp. NPDC051133 TaxID=3155521 RepID=UPI003440D321
MLPLETRAADAQTALTCLGVLYQEGRPEWLNVCLTDLRRSDCDGLWLHGVNFDGACLEAASVYQVNLSKASLIAANLRHAELGTSILHQVRCLQADLRGARLVKADLRSADFSRADLREANLRKARAQDAVFDGADLRLADLRGASDLNDTDLREARMEGALASDLTILADGLRRSNSRPRCQRGPWHRIGQSSSGCRAHEASPAAAIGADPRSVSDGGLSNLHSRERAGRQPALAQQGRRPHRDLRVNRKLVQRAPSPHQTRLPQTRRIRQRPGGLTNTPKVSVKAEQAQGEANPARCGRMRRADQQ